MPPADRRLAPKLKGAFISTTQNQIGLQSSNPGAHLHDLDAGEGPHGARGALRLGLRRVPERAALVPPPREELRTAAGRREPQPIR